MCRSSSLSACPAPPPSGKWPESCDPLLALRLPGKPPVAEFGEGLLDPELTAGRSDWGKVNERFWEAVVSVESGPGRAGGDAV
jgi:hypothetical protein